MRSERILLLASMGLLAVPSCKEEKPTPASPECGEGEVADGNTCVPESCGTGTWGDLPVDDETVYVDADAPEGGDGSEAHPLTGIQAGLDLAASQGATLVAVAAGTYTEFVSVSGDHGGIHLAGRCMDLVHLDGSGTEDEGVAVGLDLGYLAFEVSGIRFENGAATGVMIGSGQIWMHDVTIQGALYGGLILFPFYQRTPLDLVLERATLASNTSVALYLESGATATVTDVVIQDTLEDYRGAGIGVNVVTGAQATLDRVTVERSVRYGLYAGFEGASIEATDLVIQGVGPDSNGTLGRGIEIDEHGSVTLERALVEGATDRGIFVGHEGSVLTIRDSTIRGTVPVKVEESGRGIEAMDGAQVVVEDSVLEDNVEVGVMAFDTATLSLIRTTVRGTQVNGNGEFGRAVEVNTGGQVTLQESVLEDNEGQALSVRGASGATVQDCDITGNGLDDGSYGAVITVSDGSSVTIQGSRLQDNRPIGVGVREEGTVATLEDTEITGMRPDYRGAFGRAVEATLGAQVTITRCTFDGNVEMGVAAFNEGTLVQVTESTVSKSTVGWSDNAASAYGLLSTEGAVIQIQSSDILDNDGPGILGHLWGHISCDDCRIEGNRFAGVVSVCGGEAVVTRSTIQGTTRDPNLLGGAGVYGWPWEGDDPFIVLDEVIIQGNEIAGLWLAGPGSYEVTRSTIAGGVGVPFGDGDRCGDAVLALEGVEAWDGESGLLLEECTFQGSTRAGIFLDGASASLSGNTYTGNEVDLVVQGQSCEDLPPSYGEAPSQLLCPTEELPTCFDAFFFWTMPTEVVD